MAHFGKICETGFHHTSYTPISFSAFCTATKTSPRCRLTKGGHLWTLMHSKGDYSERSAFLFLCQQHFYEEFVGDPVWREGG